MDGIGGTRAKHAMVALPGMGPTPPMLVWSLVAHFSTSSCQVASYVKIIKPKKSLVNLSSVRSLKRQNTQNMYFLSRRVITKIRGR
jgi:hypothetical protein